MRTELHERDWFEAEFSCQCEIENVLSACVYIIPLNEPILYHRLFHNFETAKIRHKYIARLHKNSLSTISQPIGSFTTTKKWNIFGWNTPNRYVFFPFRIRLFSLWQWHITNSHYINETRSVTTRWDHLRNFFRLFWSFSYYYFFYDSICIANPRFLWLVYAAEQNTHAHAHRKRNAISHAF